MDRKYRLEELDALRGIAAFAVVLYHYTTRYDELYTHEKGSYLSFDYGNLGVNLFFILSGFVIFMTLNRTSDGLTFMKKRAIRLYPAYIFAVVLTYFVILLYGLEGREVGLIEATVNLTMLQGHIPNIDHVDGAYWSLTVELTFYAIVALSLYLGLTKKPMLFSVLLLTMGLILKTANIFIGSRITGLLEAYTISNFIHLFVAGIMFYLIRFKAHVNQYIIVLACLIYQFVFNDLASSFVVTGFFILFFLIIKDKVQFLKSRPLVFLGTISYSFYLLHQNIGYIIINKMELFGLNHEIFLVIPITIIIAMSTLLTFYIEKPIAEILNKKLKDSKLSKLEIADNK